MSGLRTSRQIARRFPFPFREKFLKILHTAIIGTTPMSAPGVAFAQGAGMMGGSNWGGGWKSSAGTNLPNVDWRLIMKRMNLRKPLSAAVLMCGALMGKMQDEQSRMNDQYRSDAPAANELGSRA